MENSRKKLVFIEDDTKQSDIHKTSEPKKRGRKKKVVPLTNELELENDFVEPKSKMDLNNIDKKNIKSNIKILDDIEINQNDKILTNQDKNIDKTNNNLLITNSNCDINFEEKIKSPNSSPDITRRKSKTENEIIVKEDNSDENNNIFLKELLTKQLKNISPSKKLSYGDIIRISKFLNISIFDKQRCSLWNGYVTNEKNKTKGTYINFYFNKKKIALHRLLYINYIGDISNEEYIKFSCEHKGKCCNINHMKKYTYNKNLDSSEEKEYEIKQDTKNKKDQKLQINTDKKKLIVEF